jgi:hypothetical protein
MHGKFFGNEVNMSVSERERERELEMVLWSFLAMAFRNAPGLESRFSQQTRKKWKKRKKKAANSLDRAI